MKFKENNLNKNISRLVKLAGGLNKPSKEYTDSLINDALEELKEARANRKRGERDITMKANWKKTLSLAAMIAIVCGLGIGVIVYNSSIKKGSLSVTSKKIDRQTEGLVKGRKAVESDKQTYADAESKPATTSLPAETERFEVEGKLAALKVGKAEKGKSEGLAETTQVARVYKPSKRSAIEYTEIDSGKVPVSQLAREQLGISSSEAAGVTLSEENDRMLAGARRAKKRSALKSPDYAEKGSTSTFGIGAAGMIPLKIKLPQPVFVGTPADVRVPNLEKPRSGSRQPFYVPKGTKNISKGKPVISSDENPIIGELLMLTDGDKEAVDGSYVELGPDLQHVTIDLGAAYDIYAILLWHFHKQPRVYFDVIVQVSDNAAFSKNVTTVFNNDLDNSAGLGLGSDKHYVETCEGKLIDAKGVRARYIRFYSNGSSSNELNHYTEAEVFGKIPTEKATQESEQLNIKLPKPAFVGTPMNDVAGGRLRVMKEKGCLSSLPTHVGGYPMAHGGTIPPNGEDVDAMFFKNYGVNPFVDTEDDHLSTFAIDVDTGSYTVVRGYLHDGHIPPEDAVRVEEFINYFKYGYAAPQKDVFAVYSEAVPWKFGTGRKNSYLLRIGLKAKQVSEENRKPAILTFVIDVSGSMGREDRLGLAKKSLRLLIEKLRPEDRIGIAIYGSRGMKIMDYKGLDEKGDILAVIDSLAPGGSTYAEEGIRIGYEMAEQAYRKGCINRVILCSDGVANVGQTGSDKILEIIEKKAEKGITLSAIGFGMGNYNDVLMERLGDKGDGHYVYIDTIAEAKRVFGENLTGTLEVVARDVKAQVDFNPEVVRSYRLIGYENRDVPDEKFRDDKYDGGEVGAGHSVTALYELKLWPDKKGTVATTYVRYKDAETKTVTEFKSSLGVEDFNHSIVESSSDLRLATTTAEFAEILRKSYWAKGATLDTVLERGQQLSQEFKNNSNVIELVDLISKAKKLMKNADVNAKTSENE